MPVRTCESLRRTLLLSGAQSGSFAVASNPEFLREGTAATYFLYPDRIVVGVDDDLSAAVLPAIYRPLTTGSYYKQEKAIPFAGYGAHSRAPIIITNARVQNSSNMHPTRSWR